MNVIPIHVPSLNDRKEDIPILVNHFLSTICSDQGIQEKSIMEDAVILLQNINWTGNIRELRNIVERLIILGGEKINASDVKTYTAIQN